MAKVLGEIAEQGIKFGAKQIGEAFSKKGTTELLERGAKQGFEEVGGVKWPPQTLDVFNKLPDPENLKTIIKETKGPNSEDAYEALNNLGHTGIFGEDALAKINRADPTRKAANVTPQKSWNLWDEITSNENVAKYQELSENNPGNFVDEGLAFRAELQLGENSNLYKYLNSQNNEVNAEFAAFLQTVDPETRASYIDLLIEAADDDELAQGVLRKQFEVLQAERRPASQITQEGGERITPDLINQAKETESIVQEGLSKVQERGMGDKTMSILSTSPELVSGDARIYNLEGKARDIFKEYEKLLEGVDQPALQWHHKFQKAVSTPYFQRAWELVDANKATVEDIIAMHRYALDQGVGAGDRLSAIMMLERIPHTELHNFAKAMGLQPSQARVKGTKISKTGQRTRKRPSTNSQQKANAQRISKIGTIAELAEDFQGAVKGAVYMTEEGLMIQEAWREVPITERSRMVQFHNLRRAQEKLLRKNNRKKLSSKEILDAETEYKRLDGIYQKIKKRVIAIMKENRSAKDDVLPSDYIAPFSKPTGT